VEQRGDSQWEGELTLNWRMLEDKFWPSRTKGARMVIAGPRFPRYRFPRDP
jgi:hypothetical protein